MQFCLLIQETRSESLGWRYSGEFLRPTNPCIKIKLSADFEAHECFTLGLCDEQNQCLVVACSNGDVWYSVRLEEQKEGHSDPQLRNSDGFPVRCGAGEAQQLFFCCRFGGSTQLSANLNVQSPSAYFCSPVFGLQCQSCYQFSLRYRVANEKNFRKGDTLALGVVWDNNLPESITLVKNDEIVSTFKGSIIHGLSAASFIWLPETSSTANQCPFEYIPLTHSDVQFFQKRAQLASFCRCDRLLHMCPSSPKLQNLRTEIVFEDKKKFTEMNAYFHSKFCFQALFLPRAQKKVWPPLRAIK